MSLLFGCICNQPQRILEALEPIRSALRAPAPVPRWGLGYVQGGQVLLSRTPRLSEQDVDFFDALERTSSDYIIGHAADDDGLRGNGNTQPFRFRSWMFAQEGQIEGFDSLLPQVAEHMPPFLRRHVAGKSSAEHLFHLFLSFLHDSSKLDDPNIPLEETRLAMRDAVALFSSLQTKAGTTRGGLGNLIVSNTRSMMAFRLAQPVFMRRLNVPEVYDEHEKRSFRGVFMVSASENPGEGFEEVPPRSALAIARDLRTEIVPLS